MIKKILCSFLVICGYGAIAQTTIGETLKYDSKVNKIAINAEELAYVEEGEGEVTLVFIHGLSSNLEAWKKNIESLKNQYTCIAIDLPGYGKSGKSKTSYSLEEYAGYIQEFVNKKQLKNAVLVGHSMGGQIAMHSVLKNPDSYKKLVLIAPAGIETFTAEEAGMMKASYTPNVVKSATEEQIKYNYEINFHEFPQDAQYMVEDRIAMKNASDFDEYTEIVVNNIHAMLEEPVFESLENIKIPVLMIFGKNDQLIPNKYFHPTQDIDLLVKNAEENIPDLRVELIDKAGHFVNFEKAEEVNTLIDDFLQKQ